MGQTLRFLAGGGELPAGLGCLQLDQKAARLPEPTVVAPAVEIGRLRNELKPQNIAVKIFRQFIRICLYADMMNQDIVRPFVIF